MELSQLRGRCPPPDGVGVELEQSATVESHALQTIDEACRRRRAHHMHGPRFPDVLTRRPTHALAAPLRVHSSVYVRTLSVRVRTHAQRALIRRPGESPHRGGERVVRPCHKRRPRLPAGVLARSLMPTSRGAHVRHRHLCEGAQSSCRQSPCLLPLPCWSALGPAPLGARKRGARTPAERSQPARGGEASAARDPWAAARAKTCTHARRATTKASTWCATAWARTRRR